MSVKTNFNEIKKIADEIRSLESKLRKFPAEKEKYKEFYNVNTQKCNELYNKIEKLNNELEKRFNTVVQRTTGSRRSSKKKRSLERRINREEIKIENLVQIISNYREQQNEIESILDLTESHLSGQKEQDIHLKIRKLQILLREMTSGKGKKTKRKKPKKPKKPRKKKN